MAPPRGYRSLQDLPQTIPVFPLSRTLLLPGTRLPLNIFEPRYLAMVDAALAGARIIGMIQPSEAGGFNEGPPPGTTDNPRLYETGGAGRITQFAETDDGRYVITLTGLCRFRIVEEMSATTPYRQALVNYSDFSADLKTDETEAEAIDRVALVTLLRKYFDKHNLKVDWSSIQKAPSDTLINSLSMMCPFEVQEKQALLEAPGLVERAKVLTALIEMATAETQGGPDTPLQ